MTKDEFRQFQLAQLPLLDEFKKICEANSLRYYLAAGTFLGAVRHQGFIPWDPDIDIIMPREDYERFLKIAPGYLDNHFTLAHYRNTKFHYNPHAKMYLNNSIIIYANKKIRKKMKDHPGIYIDIAPLDRAPQDLKMQQKQAKRIKRYDLLRYFKSRVIYSRGLFGYKVVARAAIRFVLLLIPIRWINLKQDQEMQKYNKSQSPLVCDMPSKYPYSKMVLPESVYGKPTNIVFEGRVFTGPEQSDAYLKRYYGDYLKMPKHDEMAIVLGEYEKVIYPI